MKNFTGYIVDKIGPYEIIEGTGPYGGEWAAKGAGEIAVFQT